VLQEQEFGVNLCSGPAGSSTNIYAVWSVHNRIANRDAFAYEWNRTTSGSATWQPAETRITSVGGQPFYVRGTATSKLSDVSKYPGGRFLYAPPSICADQITGTLYLVFTNRGNPLVPLTGSGGDRDIYVIKSTNQASTWGLPVKVNQDAPGTPLADQWFPRIAWDNGTGRLVAAFHDSRNHNYSAGDHAVDVYLAVSGNGGVTWEDLPISDGTYTPNFPDVGNDYIGLVAGHGRAYVAWADTRSGPASLKVYFTRVLLWGPVDGSLAASFEHLPGEILRVTVTWQTNMAASSGDRVTLISPAQQQYTSAVCTSCTSNGTSHTLVMDVPCVIGTWQFKVASAESFGTSRTSGIKTFTVHYCLD
jgi:hypothetical protein